MRTPLKRAIVFLGALTVSALSIGVTAPFTSTPQAQAQAQAQNCSSRTGQLRLWPLGDSLTVGGYGDPAGFTDSYRYELWRALAAEGPPPLLRGAHGRPYSAGFEWGGIPPAGSGLAEFSHDGLGGYTTARITAEVDPWIPIADPDVIVLNIGTNGGTPAEYNELIDRLHKKVPQAIIVMGTLPLTTGELGGNALSDQRAQLSAEVRRLGGLANDDYLIASDVTERMRRTMTAADYHDSVHLQISGGTKFAQALLPEVRAALTMASLQRCVAAGSTPPKSAVTSGAKVTTRAKVTTVAPNTTKKQRKLKPKPTTTRAREKNGEP
jgi:lysophospholipase L1-like esterase